MYPLVDPSRLGSVPWAPVPAPTGLGWLLLAILPGDAFLLAPPGTHLPGAGESDAGRWRMSGWAWRDEADLAYEHLATLEVEQVVLDTAFVLEMLPDDQRDWVRRVMVGQVRDAYAFSSVPAGDFLDDDRALACAWRLSDLRDELAVAFPDDDWYAVVKPDRTTVDALIAQRPALPAPPPRRARADARGPWAAPLWARVAARGVTMLLALPLLSLARDRARGTALRRALKRVPGAQDVRRELDRGASAAAGPHDDQATGELMTVA